MKQIFSLFIAAIVLGACISTSSHKSGASVLPKPRPIIFYNGTILTMEKDNPQAQAIAIRGQKILAVGGNEEILALEEPQTLVVDLGGRTLMPGFVDAHTHLLNDARSQGMSLDEAQWKALRNGITNIGDLFVDRSFLREIQTFNEAGSLRVRTSLYLVYNDPCGHVFGTWYKAYPSTRLPGEMLRINGVKIFTDGGSCGRPALSFELRKGEGMGDLWMTQNELNHAVEEAQTEGYQVAIHAIGDRAVEQSQNAIAYALHGKPNVYRHRMEHISVLQPGMAARFQELGIIPVIPGEYPSCVPFGPPLPAIYGSWEWPWKELREDNPELNIAWHTDYPFASISPIVHLYGFVTRNDVYRNFTCTPRKGLRDDTLSVEQALSMMTIQSAFALFREEEVGSLQPGKYADILILSENPMKVDPANLLAIRIIATMVGGRFEYCTPDESDLCPEYEARVPVSLPDTRPPISIRWLMLVLIPALSALPFVLHKFMTTSSQRIEWTAGIVGGLSWIITLWFDLELSPAGAWLFLLAVLLLSIFISGMSIHILLGRWMRVFLFITGLGVLAIGEGFVLSAWFKSDLGWPLWMFGVLINIAGLLLFGIANRKARVLPRLNLIPLIMGVFGVLSFLLSGSQISNSDLPVWILVISLGCGWILMGGLLILKRD